MNSAQSRRRGSRGARCSLLLIASAGWLSATPTVGTPSALPASIIVNTATLVTVTAQITDPTLIAGGANLLQVDATGKTLAILGVMHDDGLNGDAVAGDKIFTLQVTLKQALPGSLYLRVSAAFTGQLLRVQSTILAVGVIGPPVISDFNPKSGTVGTTVTVIGSNFVLTPAIPTTLTLNKQGGGTVAVALIGINANSLVFVIPPGTITGPVTISIGSQSASTATPLTITAGTIFSVTAAPGTANLIQGQSVAFAIQLSSASGFSELAQLSVSGVPTGVTAAFKPPNITVGQTSVLTLTAPANQPLGSAVLTITGSASFNGLPLSASANAQLAVQAPTTTFLGRTVVSNSLETPLAGVTITMLGKDGNGNITGCVGGAVSDAGGNFVLANLAAMCTGPQLVGFNGTTATSPPGKYAGVNLVFTLNSGQVTASPVLVHLPRIDNVETFLVTQNSPSDQSHAFTSIPGLSVTAYAGTTFTMPDGTQPNPFPLAAVQVPVDRLPDAKPFVPTMLRVFIVAFQPANATTNQPVAVYFPNTINVAPGVDMPLMTLDPTRGQMVPYGTGTVSSDGTQIVPDMDPSHPGHRFGLMHFDWHGPMPPPPPTTNPSPPCNCPPGATCVCPASAGGAVDLSSGVDVIKATDISMNGPRGRASIDRVFRTMSNNPGPFGIGSGFNYGYQLGTFAFIQGQGIITLVMPDGNQFALNRQADGTFIDTTIPTLRGAVMSPSSGIYNMRWKDGTIYQFQSTAAGGRIAYLTSITDANGNTTTLNLNPSVPGQVIQITDPVGRSLNLTYDASNRVTLITDPIGRTVQYGYNQAGYLASVIDPNGGMTTYSYDSQNRLMNVKDPRGILTEQNTYDGNGRVTQQVQADGGMYQFAYTLLNPLVGTSPPVLTIVTDPRGNQTTYRFDPNQLLTDVTDPNGQTTTSTLDPTHSNLVTAISGTAECSVCGNPAQGNQTFTLDQNGNVLTNTDANGNPTSYTYEPVFNKVTSITDPLGNVTKLSYDSHGNLLMRTDPNGNTTSFVYNPFGQVTQITDPANQKTTFTYDSFGNLATVTDALQSATTTVYDALSRPIQATDALGRVTQTTYDTLSRVVSQTNAQGNLTKFGYDSVGNLTSVTDTRHNSTSFTYDGMNRLLTRMTPLGPSDSRTYDFNGNLITFTDRKVQKSSFGYDSLNRLVSEIYADGTVGRSYDANGRLLQVKDSGSGVFEFTYDLAGRLTGSTGPVGEVQYTYDRASRVQSRQVAGQAPAQYSYDHAGNLLAASTASANVSRTYDPRSLVLSASRANGVNSQYAYDALGRLQSLTHSGPAGVLNSQTYTYDTVGNRASDATTIAQPLNTQAVAAASYDVNNEQNQFGSTANAFDANGNLISASSSSGSTTYAWDSRNRLATVSVANGQTTKFIYDFAGNLIQQMDSGPSANLTQTFALDALSNVAFVNRSDGDEYSVLTGQSLDQHDAVVHANGQIEYGLSDAINNTIATVDQTGTIKGRFSYEPFGQTTATNSSYPFQYTGRVPVSNSLYYYRARFYSPTMGRFISEDPIGFAGQSTNLYAYVGNSPVDSIDPLGLLAIGPFPPIGGPKPLPPPTLPPIGPTPLPISGPQPGSCQANGPGPIEETCTLLFPGPGPGVCTYDCTITGIQELPRGVPGGPCPPVQKRHI